MDTSNAAVTFGDLAGFTALTEAHGDIAAADIAEQLVVDAESVLGVGDRLVKAIGDAVLLTSVDAASAITLIFRLFDACERDARFPDLRAGLHFGSVVERGGDVDKRDYPTFRGTDSYLLRRPKRTAQRSRKSLKARYRLIAECIPGRA